MEDKATYLYSGEVKSANLEDKGADLETRPSLIVIYIRLAITFAIFLTKLFSSEDLEGGAELGDRRADLGYTFEAEDVTLKHRR